MIMETGWIVIIIMNLGFSMLAGTQELHIT